ncbi:MAG TPA: SpoIIE family protein phosphatase, partial [Anaerolineales bacterium]|nr:SpoIIE family protein phosphatase [Anaerolineales bacterium]
SSLAMHYESAGQPERAQKYFEHAARSALNHCANTEAEGYLHSALRLSEEKRTQAGLYDLLGETYYRQGNFTESIAAWRSGIEIYKELGDLDAMARLYAHAGRAAAPGVGTVVSRSIEITQEGLAAMAGAPDSVGLAMLIHEAGRAYLFNGMGEKAFPLVKQALAMAESLNAVDVQADSLATLGLLPGQPPHEIQAAFERAIELSEKAGLLQIAYRANVNLGSHIQEVYGDPYRAREHYQKATELAVRRGALMEEFLSRTAYASTTLDMGELDEVERLLPSLKLLLSQTSDPGSKDWSLRMLEAWLIGHRGDWARTRDLMAVIRAETMEHSEIIAQGEYGMMWIVANLEYNRFHPISDWAPVEAVLEEVIKSQAISNLPHNLAPLIACHVYARQGKVTEARQWRDKLRSELHPDEFFANKLDLMACEAAVAAAERSYTQAIEIYTELIDLFERAKGPLGRAYGLIDLAEVYLLRNQEDDSEQARQLLEQARDLFYGMHAKGNAANIDHRLEVLSQSQSVSLRSVVRELSDAGKIQASFLPDQLPTLEGWDLAVEFNPARQTSGDFYDFIPLPDGKLAIIVADVSDKGAGAALFMTLSRTVLRTYIQLVPDDPALALREASARILADSHSGMFVTVFYGLLDPPTGRLRYVNAGHNPPYLYRPSAEEPFSTLNRTGMPLG